MPDDFRVVRYPGARAVETGVEQGIASSAMEMGPAKRVNEGEQAKIRARDLRNYQRRQSTTAAHTAQDSERR